MNVSYNSFHRFANRITRYRWLSEIDDLRRYYWLAQPHVPPMLSLWLRSWINPGSDSLTMLFLWGQNGTGKSIVAKALAKYHMLNLACPTLECVPWSAFVDDQLNGSKMEINWEAKLLVLDGLDERRAMGNTLSTWLLDKLIGRLKYRAEYLKAPTIITSNRNPLLLEDWLATSPQGNSSADTKQASRTLISAFERHCHTAIKFKDLPFNIANSNLSKPDRNKHLVKLAKETNDMKKLGFEILEDYDETTIWTSE